MVAVPNSELQSLSASKSYADNILNAVDSYISAGMTISIAVGNEPLASWYNGAYDSYIVGAVTNMINAVADRNLSSSVNVTVPFSYGIMSTSYPPDAGCCAHMNPLFFSLHAAGCEVRQATMSRLPLGCHEGEGCTEQWDRHFTLTHKNGPTPTQPPPSHMHTSGEPHTARRHPLPDLQKPQPSCLQAPSPSLEDPPWEFGLCQSVSGVVCTI